MTYSPISLAAEVQDGLTARRAVVALETSAIAQGLPFPFNLEAADRMEVAIRGAGAIPAMVGVLDGVIRVGLGRSEVRRLAEGADVVKLGRRDLAAAAAFRETGGTTVSAVLHVCTMTGVAVFATGGIGGVHRGGALDVSEDLAALTCSSVVVVCSGAKSLLDLPATVERLEVMV
ncbi:MAG: pseudouridine-5'-phosphate glycosidase [Dehalococcoidia bacterium]